MKNPRKKYDHVNLTPEASAVLKNERQKPNGLSGIKFASAAIVEKASTNAIVLKTDLHCLEWEGERRWGKFRWLDITNPMRGVHFEEMAPPADRKTEGEG